MLYKIFYQRFFEIFTTTFCWLQVIWLPSNGFAQVECPSINVKIQNIGNNNGVIALCDFETEEGFLVNVEFASKTMLTQIRGKDAILSFQILNREIML
jgi:hypothetical protein